jgi:hypothetical protein
MQTPKKTQLGETGKVKQIQNSLSKQDYIFLKHFFFGYDDHFILTLGKREYTYIHTIVCLALSVVYLRKAHKCKYVKKTIR